MGSFLLAASLLFLDQPAVVGPPVPATVGPPAPAMVGPPAPVAPRPRTEGEEPPEEGEDGEMVVTGERYDENSPYRVPMQFRNQRSDDDQDASWTSRVNDEEAVQRFGSQTVGQSGWLQGSRQRECQWRAERQMAQGRRPDCGARSRPNSDDDWQRRSGNR